MIRINLSGAKKEVKKAGGGPSVSLEGAKLTLFFVGFLLLGLGYVAGRYYQLQSKGTELDEKIVVAEKEKARLATVKAQYEQQEAYKRDLSRRIDIIEGLKRGQTGPVEMLNQLAGAVQANKTLWLTSFDNVGNRVNMVGSAISVTAVADFINTLKRTGYFSNVEIREAYQDDRSAAMTTFLFTLTAELVLPGSQSAAGTAKPKT